jgi:hypothetical protein
MPASVAAGALALCLSSIGATGTAVTAQIPLDGKTQTFSIAWMHSIEKTQWTEQWMAIGHSASNTHPHLRLLRARIETSGAGMEIPEGAVLRHGGYDYEVQKDLPSVTLSHSPFTAQATLCAAGECRVLTNWLKGLPKIAAVELTPCTHQPGL